MASLEPSEEEAGDVEDAEDTPLLELTAPTRTRRAWLTCILVTLLAALLMSLTSLASAKLRTTQDWKDNLQGKQGEPQPPPGIFTLGGTLVEGPGCPAVCGSFVFCKTDRRSRNNLLQLQIVADSRPVAYDNASGELSYQAGWREQFQLVRLSNKQLVPRTPDFQCPETECFIPRSFIDDDFCDCPLSCADETYHTCDSCGVDLPAFSREDDICPAEGTCRDFFDLGRIRPRCVGLGSAVDAFSCPSGGASDTPCTIDRSLVDNDQCDCPGTCADESRWSCENCSCVNYCGVPPFPCSSDGVFQCPATQGTNCSLPAGLRNNGECECPETCADEDPIQAYNGVNYPVNCEVCTCPGACGQLRYSAVVAQSLLEGDGPQVNCLYGQEVKQLTRFHCPPPAESCSVPQSFVNDNVCDCPGTCADEDNWNCANCACPEVCGTRNHNCFDLHFRCPESSCKIAIYRVNDGSCDCPTCADEAGYTCETCQAGCPTELDCNPLHTYQCEARVFSSSASNCFIPFSWINDDTCDCRDCGDEQNWDCSNCSSGCPIKRDAFGLQTINSRSSNCFGEALAPEFDVECPGYPAQAPLPATPLGCSISRTSVNDNKCDCPTCRDEAREECESLICSSGIFCSPGGVNSLVCACPTDCGKPTDCAGKCVPDPNPYLFQPRELDVPLRRPVTPECLYVCPSGASCAKHVQVLNNSVCDCLGCEDEASWSCETCQCPLTAPDFLDYPKVGCDFKPLDVVLQGKGDVDNAVGTKSDSCPYPASLYRQFSGPPQAVPFPKKQVLLQSDRPSSSSTLTKDTMAQKLVERRDRNPRWARLDSRQWEELLNSALADGRIREAIGSAAAQGYTQQSWEAIAAAVSQKFQVKLRENLVFVFLEDIDVRKAIENCAAEGFSHQPLESLKEMITDFVRMEIMKSQEIRKSSAKPAKTKVESARRKGFAGLMRGTYQQGRSLRRLQSDEPATLVPCPGSTCSAAEASFQDGICGCAIPDIFLQDGFCDCPDCADEGAFTCDSCIPTEPFFTAPVATQTDLGVAVGVSLGVAVGVGVGIGLGVSSAVGAGFAAVGFVQFIVSNAQDFETNPQVQQGLKNAFVRLAGLTLPASAVTLNFACAGDALANLASKLRRLGSEVRLCFEIEIEGEKESLEACEVLVGTSPTYVAQVIQEELADSNVAEEIEVVRWSPEPNPKSFNPTLEKGGIAAFKPPSSAQFVGN